MRVLTLVCLPVAMAFAAAPPPPSSRPSLEVRGGGLFSDLPIFSQASNAIKTHIEPILKNPNGRILQPLQAFAKQKAGEAKQRQVHYRRTTTPTSSMGFALLSPMRIVRLGVTALVFAEVVDYLGILEDPKIVKKRVVTAFQQAKVTTLQRKTQNWWKGARRQGGILNVKTWSSPSALTQKVAKWQPKHQFALGAGGGLMLSQSFWCIAHQVFKTGAVVYTLSELNQLVKRRSGQSVPERFGNNFGDKVEKGLENVRVAVRWTIRDPTHLADTVPKLLERYVPDGGFPSGTKSGFASGLVAGIIVI